MNSQLLNSLIECETDVDGASKRFCGNEKLYLKCLKSFLSDPTMAQLEEALDKKSWDDAASAAHALKGLAGNMGFTPLYNTLSEIVNLIRTDRLDEAEKIGEEIKINYKNIVAAINQNKAALE